MFRHISSPLLAVVALLAARPCPAQQVRFPITARTAISPVVLDGVAYLSADGTLDAYRVADGSHVAGFPAAIPVEYSFWEQAPYLADGRLGIFLPGSLSRVMRVNTDGTVAWIADPDPQNTPFGGPAVPRCAVDSDSVFAIVLRYDGTHLMKLRSSDGAFQMLSPVLASAFNSTIPPYTTSYQMVYTPSVVDNIVYVARAALNQADLTVRAQIDIRGGNAYSPFVKGLYTYYVGGDADVQKVNRTNLNVDTSFGAASGTPGYVSLGTGLHPSVGPFIGRNPANGHDTLIVACCPQNAIVPQSVYALDLVTETVTRLYAGTGAEVVGYPVVNERGVVAFSSKDASGSSLTNTFVQVPLSDPVNGKSVTTLTGEVYNPCYDLATHRFYAVQYDGQGYYLCGFDSK